MSNNEIEFGEPRNLPVKRTAFEIEIPYFFNYSSRIIKVSASDALVSRWQKRNKDILGEMKKSALEHLHREIRNASLGDYEVLELTTINVSR